MERELRIMDTLSCAIGPLYHGNRAWFGGFENETVRLE